MKSSTLLPFLILLLTPAFCASARNISAVFTFGDSTLDPGNNNAIPFMMMRADHPPYGCRFPGRVATGRFTDGLLVPDFVVSRLGLRDVLPAYLDPKLSSNDLSTGVSFASAGSGLDDMTSTDVAVFTIGQQVEHFREYLGRLQTAVGATEGDRVIGDALFVICTGGNDMMWTYYLHPTVRVEYTVSDYQDLLQRKLQSIVKQLYNLGGRKFAITGLPPLGCLPFTMTTAELLPGPNMLRRTCVDQQNDDAIAYNSKLQKLIPVMQLSLPNVQIAYTDIYNPVMDMMLNPQDYGFEKTTEGCCGTGMMEIGPLCGGAMPTCADPSKYLFWDSVHPTQAAYKVVADYFVSQVLPQFL